ncbi:MULTISPECIES: 50S ribosomal protein L11 methyltransferase [unclassified Acidisoma]|jgi:ribosomal protein L11 methyltransferase|uniref:50S ribosomal protein L11 methyltransferase n=1 Tax=unclassified Acidisoma TaxID=2634065 RepID=UPI00131D2AA1|nr:MULTISPECIES: 50S ribosomal protein L11 methyltransferase [unclassified Acidisoma]
MTRRRATPLETIALTLPEEALPAYESALLSICSTVGFFRDGDEGPWRLEAVKPVGEGDNELVGALALAAMMTGVEAVLERSPTEAEGWLVRNLETFPEQEIGRRFAIRGTHETAPLLPGRITLTVDAGVAFGSGEHGSTRGCLRAFESIAHLHPRRILDLGTGSGILAMAAAKLLRRPVLATDIDPWSVRVTRQNAAANRVGGFVQARLADGWRSAVTRSRAPYDLVFANILARPLCAMAWPLADNLLPGGHAILAGLLASQERMVVGAHRRQGMVLKRRFQEGQWTALLLHNPSLGRP